MTPAPPTPPKLPPAPTAAALWRLDPALVHLNHGSFGACPAEVLDAQRAWIDRMERDAVTFFVDDLWPLLDAPRAALAPVLGCQPEDIVFVPNATHGVAHALHNLDLRPGDEILANTHEYPACLNIARDHARRAGATLVTPDLPWPVPSADALADAILSAVTARTRVCLLSAVTSPSAIVMPVERIARGLRTRGVELLLDGAHAAGFSPLDLSAWGVAWATGNAHKWLCAPKGAAWLYVRPDLQRGFHPNVLSNHAEDADAFGASLGRSAFGVEFDYVGTRDVSGTLAIADAIVFLERQAGSIDAYAARNRALALRARDTICRRLGLEPPVPDDLCGAMATIPLPPPTAPPEPTSPWESPLKRALFERWRVQVPVWGPPGAGRSVRISANLYNGPEQYAYLAEALATELARGV